MKKIENTSKELIKQIIEISFKYRLGHIGSCLSVIEILDTVYELRKKDEPVVLSNGHAGLALYVILEKYGLANAEVLSLKYGTHPSRDLDNGIYASTGSLGQGLPIAVGMALADRSKNIYCILSDGECAEGSIWEAARVASEQKLSNLKIIVNANGYGGYDLIDISSLAPRFKAFGCNVIETDGHTKNDLLEVLKTIDETKPLVVIATTTSERFSFLKGIDAHYKVMEEPDYLLVLKELNS